MVTDAEVEAAGEAMAKHGMDETLLGTTAKPVLQMMSAENRESFLARVRAGLEAAEAVRLARDVSAS